MKKAFLMTLLLAGLAASVFAEGHSLGFACLDVDAQGVNRAVVSYLVEGSPAAGKDGLQLGDVILAVNGQSVEGLYFRQVRTLLKSDAPTEFAFKVSRGGKQAVVKLKSVPASSLAGKKGTAADEAKLNPNYRIVPVFISASNTGRVHPTGGKKDIENNQVTFRIRLAGEEWWLFETTMPLDDEGKLNPFKVDLPVDISRTYYFEMVYKRTNGKFYGDYVYMRGADLVKLGNNPVQLLVYQQFERPASLPNLADYIGPKSKVQGNFAFKLTGDGFRYYESRGYVFPDKGRVTILGTDGKPFFDQEVEVGAKWNPESDFWMLYSTDINKCFFQGPDQPTEGDITFILTVEALKDGKPETLTFQVRETLFWTRNNTGFFQRNRYSFTWWFDAKGQLTKLAP